MAYDAAADSGLTPGEKRQQLFSVRNSGTQDIVVTASCSIAGLSFKDAANSEYLTSLGGGPGVTLQMNRMRSFTAQSMGIVGDDIFEIVEKLATYRSTQADLMSTDLTLLVTGAPGVVYGTPTMAYIGTLCAQPQLNPYSAMVIPFYPWRTEQLCLRNSGPCD